METTIRKWKEKLFSTKIYFKKKRNVNSTMPLCLLESHLIFAIDYESKDKH